MASPPTNPFSSFSIYFLIIIAAFLALFIATALLLYSCRCRVACGFLWQCLAYRASRGRQPPDAEAIPVHRYREDQSFSSECSVCLTAFREGEKVRQLPACRHSFHVPCVDTWLYSNSSCPSCRTPVPRAAAAVCPRTEALEDTHSNQQQQQQMMMDSRGEADAIASIL